jgi:hypothetical protein
MIIVSNIKACNEKKQQDLNTEQKKNGGIDQEIENLRSQVLNITEDFEQSDKTNENSNNNHSSKVCGIAN